MSGQRGEEELVGGRVGRFNRRFEGMGGSKSGGSGRVDWMESMDTGEEGSNEQKVPSSKPSIKDTKGRK